MAKGQGAFHQDGAQLFWSLRRWMTPGGPLPHCLVPMKPGPKAAHLPAPADLLVKNPKLVADPVAVGRQAQRRHGVQKAGWGRAGGGCQGPVTKHPVPPAGGPRSPASRPKPPLPSPASSSISSSSSMSRPSWRGQGGAAVRAKGQPGRPPRPVCPPPDPPDLVNGLVAGVLQGQVHHGVLQRPAHVELQRQVVDPLPETQARGGRVRAARQH